MGKNVIKDRRPPRVYRIERDEKTGTVIIHVGVKWPSRSFLAAPGTLQAALADRV
jgi:hypothetical protein